MRSVWALEGGPSQAVVGFAQPTPSVHTTTGTLTWAPSCSGIQQGPRRPAWIRRRTRLGLQATRAASRRGNQPSAVKGSAGGGGGGPASGLAARWPIARCGQRRRLLLSKCETEGDAGAHCEQAGQRGGACRLGGEPGVGPMAAQRPAAEAWPDESPERHERDSEPSALFEAHTASSPSARLALPELKCSTLASLEGLQAAAAGPSGNLDLPPAPSAACARRRPARPHPPAPACVSPS